jgi:uncharacterized protein (DUF934 family)
VDADRGAVLHDPGHGTGGGGQHRTRLRDRLGPPGSLRTGGEVLGELGDSVRRLGFRPEADNAYAPSVPAVVPLAQLPEHGPLNA